VVGVVEKQNAPSHLSHIRHRCLKKSVRQASGQVSFGLGFARIAPQADIGEHAAHIGIARDDERADLVVAANRAFRAQPVEQRALSQWFFRITAYANELLDHIKQLEGGWPDRVLTMQRNWIGRSEGTEVDFGKIRVFTTRVDTIFGATCVILAPEHPLAAELLDEDGRAQAKAMVDARANQGPGDINKEGFFTGTYTTNPYSGERVPVWIGNFVLMGYGTGAIMAVPAHDERDFEFCTKYGIPIRPVIRPVAGEAPA